VPKFLFFMGVPGPEAEKFSAEFMATGLHLSMP
jgi:hypothetical protein